MTISYEEAQEYFKGKYKKGSENISFYLPQDFWLDYQMFLLTLSKKKKRKISGSERVRILMTKDMLENQARV